MSKFGSFWQRLVKKEEIIKPVTDIVKTILDLGQTLRKEKLDESIEQIMPQLGGLSTFIDILNSPLAKVVGSNLPFIGIAISLLKYYQKRTEKLLTLEQCAVVVGQAAYLKSLTDILDKGIDETLKTKIADNQNSASSLVEKEIDNLKDLELDDQELLKTIDGFPNSKLAEAFSNILKTRLKESGLDDDEANILCERIAWNTPRYVIEAWAESGDVIKHFTKPSVSEWSNDKGKYQSINDYLKEEIAKKPEEPVFKDTVFFTGNRFSYRDVYVPLKAEQLDENWKSIEYEDPFDIEERVKKILLDPEKQDQIIFIEGEPGRGKSVFCRMFADRIRQELYPAWIPILIPLRDVEFKVDIEDTLKMGTKRAFALDTKKWLYDKNTRFFFLLDGFDELVISDPERQGLPWFFDQLGRFQTNCMKNYSELGHRVLITGRSTALHWPGIERLMLTNLERIRLLPMDDECQQKWFEKWLNLLELKQIDITKVESLIRTLKSPGCSDELKELAREPLLLTILAVMYQESKLNSDMFLRSKDITFVYEEVLDWVLHKQRDPVVTKRLAGFDEEVLQNILREAGLCVIQSANRGYASVKMISERSQKYSRTDKAPINLDTLQNALVTFYLQSNKEGGVTFAHKSFGEFLFTKQLKESLEDWTVKNPRNENNFNINDSILEDSIYDLLGYGGLTPGIVNFLMSLISQNNNHDSSQLEVIFNRLSTFYSKWNTGEFINADSTTNLPLKKTKELSDHKIYLGVREVDIYTGINVMILLLELYRLINPKQDSKDYKEILEEKIIFYPCGNRNDPDAFNKDRLLRIIGYSHCIDIDTFARVVGSFLIRARLNGTNLSGTYLAKVNFKDAHLSNTNLNGAYLKNATLVGARLKDASLRRVNLNGANLENVHASDADFSGATLNHAILKNAVLCGTDFSNVTLSDADLTRAYLGGAKLIDTNLSRACLKDAVLCGADLSGANLSGANLEGTDLRGANLKNIHCNLATNWKNAKAMHRARHVPDELKAELFPDLT